MADLEQAVLVHRPLDASVAGCLDILKPITDCNPGTLFDCHLTRFIFDDDVVLKERGGVLRDGVQSTTQGRKGGAVHSVRVAHGDYVWVSFVHRSMQNKAGAIDGVATLDHSALVVHQNEI